MLLDSAGLIHLNAAKQTYPTKFRAWKASKFLKFQLDCPIACS